MIDEDCQILATEVIGASHWYPANLCPKLYVTISPDFTLTLVVLQL